MIRSAGRLAIVVVAVAAVAAACAAEGPASTTTSTTGTTTTTPATTPATSAPTTMAAAMVTATPPADAGLFAFAGTDDLTGWRTQNDPVMGGRSTSMVSFADGTLVFAGNVSLENNGGFASVVSPPLEPEAAARLAAQPGLRVEVQGDGKTYVVQLRTGSAATTWIRRVATTAGSTTAVFIPWTQFEPVDRFLNPRPSAVDLDPAQVGQLAFYILDKQTGPFRLAVRAIG